MIKKVKTAKIHPVLLCDVRRRKSTATDADNRTILEQAHSDRGRVIFSASFRRLAQKTQVFALSLDGARTRLTHSLEVAHIGTYIVEEVFKKLDAMKRGNPDIKLWQEYKWDERQAIRSFVEVSCLVHDIGNPPFGHFGEKAICNWFDLHKTSKWFTKVTNDKGLVHDFMGFDGNKQGFRILTKLQRNGGDKYGLNLTFSQLASTVKYPTLNIVKPTKCSFFQSESNIKDDIWKKLNLAKEQRHPLSLIMEAADDIAYCVSDLEDAAEKGLVTEIDLKEAFGNIDFSNITEGITKARTGLTNLLVSIAAVEFINRMKNDTHYAPTPIFKSNQELEKLKVVTREKVYSSRIVLSNEITGYKIIQGILDAFVPLLNMKEVSFIQLANAFEHRNSIHTEGMALIIKSCIPEPSLLSLFPRKHLAVYREAIEDPKNKYSELFHRVHLVIDFVAGMTDDFALSTYRLMSGQVTYGQQ